MATKKMLNDSSGQIWPITRSDCVYMPGTSTNIKDYVDGQIATRAASSHGNHVPTTQTANNAKFLRNDNTWQTVTPTNIGAQPRERSINFISDHTSNWTSASPMSGLTYAGGWHGTVGSDGYISLGNSGSYKLSLFIDGDFYAQENKKVYHEGNKPTPADIGAAAASHGTHLTIGTGAGNAAAGNHTHSYANKFLSRDEYTQITVNGDANKYYPVILSTSNVSSYPTITVNISRTYSWTAPSTWNTSTHKGGLTFTLEWNCSKYWDGNGTGSSNVCYVTQFCESYCTMVAGLSSSTTGIVVWLRGGGALYQINSSIGKAVTAEVKLEGFTDSASQTFSVRDYNETTVNNEIKKRWVNRSTSGVYDNNNRVYSAGNKPTPADIGAAAASHGTHLTIGTGASNAAAGNHTHSNYVPSTYLVATASELKYSGNDYKNKGSKVSLGYNNTVSGTISAALGDQNVVDGDEGVAIGRYNKVHGYGSLAIGDYNEIYSGYVFVMGESNTVGTTTNDNASNLVVIGTGNNLTGSGIERNIIIGNYAKCTGSYGNAIGSYAECHNGGNSLGYGCEGWDKGTALGRYSKAFGYYSICGGYYADTGGENSNGEPNRDLGYCGVAFGYSPKAIANNTVALGYCASAQSNGSYAMGYEAVTTGLYSTALGGYYAKAKASYSLASGYYVEANGDYSSVFGVGTTTSSYGENMFVIGHYNDTNWSGSSSGTNGAAFTVGNGTGNYGSAQTRSNACVISYAGQVMGKAAYSTSGADYAEYFEWIDGNPDAEDRVGYFVTLDGNKIRKAKSGEYLLGIVSGHPAVLGNHDLAWHGQYLTDEFDRPIKKVYKDIVEIKETKSFKDIGLSEEEFEKLSYDERRELLDVTVEKEVEYESFAINPDYDPNKEYIPREDRPEWDAIGMMGVLAVHDDGTCEVNGFCKCNNEGIATACERGCDSYRVIKRVNDHIVKIIFK